MTICKCCGKEMIKKNSRQMFCCQECRKKYEKHHHKIIEHRKPTEGDHIIREFFCRQCGKHVLVVDEKDKRTVYCQQACEKKYWREVTKTSRHGRSGNNLSGGMSLQSLIRREREDLK